MMGGSGSKGKGYWPFSGSVGGDEPAKDGQEQSLARVRSIRNATPFVFTRRSSLYYDEDGDLAHEFYEEMVVTKNGRKKAKLKRIHKNLIPQIPSSLIFLPTAGSWTRLLCSAPVSLGGLDACMLNPGKWAARCSGRQPEKRLRPDNDVLTFSFSCNPPHKVVPESAEKRKQEKGSSAVFTGFIKHDDRFAQTLEFCSESSKSPWQPEQGADWGLLQGLI
ncbi:unnamed protein product [Leuciscus chuanchicus]